MRPDRKGIFKAIPLEWGVAKTQAGFPTFNIRAKFVAYYDETEKEWIDWAEYDMDTTAFLCLFGYKKGTKDLDVTLNHTQVMTVFGWNGESLQELAEGDYSNLVFQVRIKDNDPEYADKNPFVVGWIDTEDADPGTTIKKLDPKDLKDLDSQFAALLKKNGKGKAAASAPKKTTAPKAPPKTTAKTAGIVLPDKTPEDSSGTSDTTLEPAAEETKPDTVEEKRRKLLEKSKKNLEAGKNEPPKRVKPKVDPPAKDLPEGKTTKHDAWCTVVELKTKDVTDDTLNETWNSVIDEIAGEGVDDKAITPEQWFKIQEKVLDKVGIF